MWFLMQLYGEGRTTVLDDIVENDQNNTDGISNKMKEKQLIEEKSGRFRLTHKGKIAVHRYYTG